MDTPSIVRTFKPQFAPLVEAGTKLQTVRLTPKRMPAKGWLIDCRAWTGRPYNSKQRKLRVGEITLVATVNISAGAGRISIDGRVLADWEADDFARQDGFRDANQMLCWFEAEHGLPFKGIVIQWKR